MYTSSKRLASYSRTCSPNTSLVQLHPSDRTVVRRAGTYVAMQQIVAYGVRGTYACNERARYACARPVHFSCHAHEVVRTRAAAAPAPLLVARAARGSKISLYDTFLCDAMPAPAACRAKPSTPAAASLDGCVRGAVF